MSTPKRNTARIAMSITTVMPTIVVTVRAGNSSVIMDTVRFGSDVDSTTSAINSIFLIITFLN